MAGAGFETKTVNYASAFPRFGFDPDDVFISSKVHRGGEVPKYDYRLLTWMQDRAAESKVQARDFARKPIAT